MNDCPDLGVCTDRDTHGKPKKRRMCFNCGTDECGADCPKNCRYHPAAWRINTNTSRFFKAIKEGHDFVPVYPPLSSLKIGETPFPIHKDAQTSTPSKKPEEAPTPYWMLYVSGCEWTSDRLSTITGFVKEKADMEVKESMLIIQCKSEGDAQELMAQFQKVSLPDGSKLHVTREHVTPTPTTPQPMISTPTPTPTPGMSAIQVTEVVDKRMNTMMEKHTHAINENFKVINLSIQKLGERQDLADKRADSQQDLLTTMFKEMQSWRKLDGHTVNTPGPRDVNAEQAPLLSTATPTQSHATSDLQGTTPQTAMDVDTPTATSSKNPIPSPPPDPSPLALQRALKKRSPVEVAGPKSDALRIKPGARVVKNVLKKRQLPARRCVKTTRASLDDLSTPVKTAVTKDTGDVPAQIPDATEPLQDSVVQTLDDLLALAAEPPAQDAPRETPPPCLQTDVMATEAGTHVYCIDAHAHDTPFVKMIAVQALSVHGHDGLLCRPEGTEAEPRFFSKDIIALTVNQAEQLQSTIRHNRAPKAQSATTAH